jgi:hypothetical protein
MQADANERIVLRMHLIWEDTMYRSILIPLSAGMILLAFAPQAMAQFNIGPGTFEFPGPAATTTVKSAKSNSSERMGGGGGGGSQSGAKATTVKSSKSNTSDRMGGGGGRSPVRSINLNSSRSNIY